jgi:flagella basal body P-ring formation protein FlgA
MTAWGTTGARGSIVVGLFLHICGGVIWGAHAAELTTLPVLRMTLYPGDIIGDENLTERDVDLGPTTSRPTFAMTRSDVVGKAARRTLLPTAPIPLSALATPKAVAHGTKVRILFVEGALSIIAYGTALQSGGVGDSVSVRNMDSGVTIVGTVQSDGSIRVGGG